MTSLSKRPHAPDYCASDYCSDGAAPRKRNRKPGRSKRRTPQWTKRAQYPGQATFDLSNHFRQLPFSKPRHNAQHIELMEIEDMEIEDPALNPPCEVCGGKLLTCSCDPLMQELNDILEQARQENHTTSSPPSLPLPDTSSYEYSHYFPQPVQIPLPASLGYPYSHIRIWPDTPSISQERLIAEVRAIYAGLVVVEQKCIDIDRSPAPENYACSYRTLQRESSYTKDPKLKDLELRDLELKDPELKDPESKGLERKRHELHHVLLNKHYDFLSASQHPSASPALRRLARKYNMPSRMWERGIDDFMKVSLRQMPGTAKHMLDYLSFARSMIDRLNAEVPSLATEWSECIKGLDAYSKELCRIIREDSNLPQYCESSPSGWTSDRADSLPTPNHEEYHYQVPNLSNFGYNDSLFNQNCGFDPYSQYKSGFGVEMDHGNSYQALNLSNFGHNDPLFNQNYGLDPYSQYKSSFGVEADHGNSYQSPGTSADPHGYTPNSIPHSSMRQAPLGTTLSLIAALVLAGWLWIGQAADVDFNIYVKVFCILAMCDPS